MIPQSRSQLPHGRYPENKRWWRLRLRIPHWAEDAFVLFLVERGLPGLEVKEAPPSSLELLAYFPSEDSVRGFEGQLARYARDLEKLHGCPGSFGWTVDVLFGEDWAEAWKAHFHTTKVSPRLVIKPSWEPFQQFPGCTVLEIDPGQAFGTGLHATTRLCLEWIDEMMGQRIGLPLLRALDVGTGTGILAIALAKLGAEDVWAIDTDPRATEAARENACKNGLGHRLVVREGSVEVLRGARFPLVVANLSGPVLRRMAVGLNGCVERNGLLLVSGLLAEEKASAGESFARAGLACLEARAMEDWCAMLLEPRG